MALTAEDFIECYGTERVYRKLRQACKDLIDFYDEPPILPFNSEGEVAKHARFIARVQLLSSLALATFPQEQVDALIAAESVM